MTLYDDWDAFAELAATVTAGTGPLDETELGCPVPDAAPGVRHRAQLPQPRRGVRHGGARRAGDVHEVPRVAGRTVRRRRARRRRAVDWEVELVAVIGRRADRVAEADGWAHIAGLTVGQDISDRTLQFAAGGQFSLGKSRRGFGPMGPWVVTPDEVADPDDLALGCSVDGETVQDARTSDLIFGVPRLVAELSAVLPLLPGDVIFTGTPAGVGATRQPPRFLQPGEVARVWVEGIGTIRNRCR